MSTTEDIKKEGAGARSEHVIPTASSGSTAQKTEEPEVESFPDPDEDDLDDLDGMERLHPLLLQARATHRIARHA